MKYEINEEIITDAGHYTVAAEIYDDGGRDDSVSLYVGRHADGHCDLIAVDNASNWVVGSEDDLELNAAQMEQLGDRVDIDAIRAVDADLADWIADRMAAARG